MRDALRGASFPPAQLGDSHPKLKSPLQIRAAHRSRLQDLQECCESQCRNAPFKEEIGAVRLQARHGAAPEGVKLEGAEGTLA